MRIFFATDIHGSEVCWRKFLNAGKFHKADVLIMGGDMTGKAMVPIVANGERLGGHAPGAAPLLTDRGRARGDGEAHQRPRLLPGPPDPRRGRRVGGRSDARRRPLQGRDARRRSSAGWRSPTSGWPAPGSAASSRRPTTTCSRSTRSSSARSTSSSARQTRSRSTASRSSRPAGRTRRPGTRSASCPSPSCASGSTGSSRRSPTRTGRSSTSTPRRTARTLTTRPKLDADMNYVAGGQALVPVGSKAVRESILAYGPPLSLHGHIHEGKGAVKLGSTLAVNPGSSYEDGVLQAAIVDLDEKKGNGEALSADQRLTVASRGIEERGGSHGIRNDRGPVAVPAERHRPGQGLVRLRRVHRTRSCR